MKLLIISLFFSIFSFMSVLNANPIETLEKVSIQFQWKYQFQFAGFIMAKELGYYQEEGLDVEFLEYDNSNTIQKLLNKEVDFIINNSSLVYKNKRLLDITLLATYFQRSPLIIITQPEIKSPLGLLGKKLMMSKNNLYNSSLSVLLEHYTINQENTNIIDPSFNIQDFIDKKVDAATAFSSNELFELDKKGIKYNIIDPVESGFATNAMSLFTSVDKAHNNKEQIERFLRATKNGWKYALANIPKTAQLIHQKYQKNKSLESLVYEGEQTKELMLQELYEIGQINKEFIHLRYKQLTRLNRLDTNQSIDKLIYSPPLKQNKINILTKEETSYLKKKKTIKVCVDPHWKPLEWLDKNQVYKGISADYLELLSSRIGIQTKIYPTTNWAESIAAIKSRKCDILPFAQKAKERVNHLDFTSPFFFSSYVIATKTDKIFINEMEDVLNEKFAIVESSAIISDLKNLYPQIQIVEVKTLLDGMKLLQNNKVFGLINIVAPLSHLIQNHSFVDVKISGKIPIGFELSVATRNDEPELNTIFEKAVNTLTEDEKNRINSKWTVILVEESFLNKFIYEIVIISLMIILAIIYRQATLKSLNRTLTKRVQDKTYELQDLNNALEKKVLLRTQQLEEQAYYDSLTGLPNRTLFNDRLEQGIIKAKRNRKELALFFIDLDKFKHINDSLGHDIGDQVLKKVSKKMRSSLRDKDILSRLGGDEFTVIIEDVIHSEEISFVAQKLIESLHEPLHIDNHTLYISASIGISIYPNDGTEIQDIVKYADTAMYKAKDEGRNNFQFYCAEMTVLASEILSMQANLKDAIRERAFVVYYQPQIDILENKLIGIEALTKWIHPTKGLVDAEHFIPIAEENGLIVEIDQIVMHNSMRQVSQWHQDGLNPGKLCINLAVKQLENKTCIDVLKSMLSTYSFDSSWLELEITESDIMKKPQEALEVLKNINALGIALSIDDFGTGYSSLSYLKHFPVSKLKIDKSFIQDIERNLDDQAIVKAIIALGFSLNLELIAEGVEIQEQENFLVENGCFNIQGYLHSKALNASDMEYFLKNFDTITKKNIKEF